MYERRKHASCNFLWLWWLSYTRMHGVVEFMNENVREGKTHIQKKNWHSNVEYKRKDFREKREMSESENKRFSCITIAISSTMIYNQHRCIFGSE